LNLLTNFGNPSKNPLQRRQKRRFLHWKCLQEAAFDSVKSDTESHMWQFSSCTDKKENQIFLIYKEIQNEAVSKSFMTNGLLIIWGDIFAFPHILGSPSSYMTLQLLHSEFIYIWGKFDFLFYQCSHICPGLTFAQSRDPERTVAWNPCPHPLPPPSDRPGPQVGPQAFGRPPQQPLFPGSAAGQHRGLTFNNSSSPQQHGIVLTANSVAASISYIPILQQPHKPQIFATANVSGHQQQKLTVEGLSLQQLCSEVFVYSRRIGSHMDVAYGNLETE
jgi:hypothetical protein